jgi:transcriptional regulator with XRE-family HTH domain
MAIKGERIHDRRRLLGLSQEELSEKAGIDQKQVSNYERGKGNPTAESLLGLAKALDTSTDWLLGLTDDPDVPRVESSSLDKVERQIIAAYRKGDFREAMKIFSQSSH